MAGKKTLLDLDRFPTLKEMQDFFKENDWSAAKIFTEAELADAISRGKELLAPVWKRRCRNTVSACGRDISITKST